MTVSRREPAELPGVPEVQQTSAVIVSGMNLLRTDEVDVVLGWVERGVNVEIVGPRVCGKTSLLEIVESSLVASGWVVARITGIAPLRDQPLEAMALAGVIEGRRPGDSVASIVDHLLHQWEDSRVTILIDDVDCLDRISCSVIDALSRRMAISLVSAGPLRPADPSTRPVFRLRHPCAELPMRPWSFAALNTLLTNRFDQVVDPWLAGRIHQLSGGVPGFALALLEAAEIESRLILTDSIWRHSDEGLWYQGLPRVIEDYIGPLPPEDRQALEQLSGLGPIEFTPAAAKFGAETLRRLESRSLISTASSDGKVHVVVFPPLVAEYLHLHQGSIPRLAALEASNDGELPPIHTEEMEPLIEDPRAISQMIATHRTVEGSRLAERWRHTPTARTAFPYVAWLVGSAQSREQIDELNRETDWEKGTSFERALSLIDLAQWEAFAGAGYDAAFKMLDDRKPTLDSYAPMADHMRLRLRIISGDVPEYDESLIPLSSDDPPGVTVSGLGTRVYHAIVTGHFAEAESASEAMGAYPERPRTTMLRSLALAMRGHLDEAIELAVEGLNVATKAFDVEGIHVCGYAASYALALQGRRGEAQKILGINLPLGRPQPNLETIYQAELFLAARLAIQSTEFNRAQSFSQQARSLQLPDGPLFGTTDLVADLLAGLTVSSGADPAIPRQIWERVEEMWRRKYRMSAIGTGLMLTETVPNAERARIVAGWIAEIDEPSFVPSGDYVLALALRDGEALAACAAGLEASGRISRAAVALTFAEEWLRAEGKRDAATIVHEDLERLLSDHPNIELDHSLQRLPAVQLSDREREIVALVARGMSNKQIAEELVLSVRTVENHIYRAFRKTRLTTRGQLRALSE